MIKYRLVISALVLLLVSCEYNRSNPIINQNIDYSNIITNSAVRDFVIIEDFTANSFHYNAINHSCTQGYDLNDDGVYEGITGEQDCSGFWCEWDGDSCNDIVRDVIAVANDEAGLFIYEIINSEINHQDIYARDLIEFAGDGELDIELRGVYYAENHNTLYMLDKFEYIYNLYLPPVISDYNDFPDEHDCILPSTTSLDYLQCGQFNHATKFVVNENNLNGAHTLPFEMFILYKENQNTDSSISESYSEIRRYWYNNNPNGDSSSSPVCDNAINFDYSCDDGPALIASLNYDVTDLFYSSYNGSDRLFISNPSNNFFSVDMYYYDPIGGQVVFKDNMVTENKVNTVYAYEDYLISGMKDDGCYITLLNQDGISDNLFDKLHIGDSFSVYDIYYDNQNNKLVLSCGNNGVLIYAWDGDNLLVELENHIMSSYAYTAKTHDSKVIIGTENGMEIFNLGD